MPCLQYDYSCNFHSFVWKLKYTECRTRDVWNGFFKFGFEKIVGSVFFVDQL